MRRSVEAVIPVLERIDEEISRAKWAARPETVEFHLQKAYQELANALNGSTSGALSDKRANEIEKAAHFLEGIQTPAELRAEALGWSKDLLALL